MSAGAGVDSEPDPTKMGTGPTINGSIEAMLTPDLLYRMNKKIAQLTKVVYGLNTRGEELEAQLIGNKESEDALRTLNNELSHKANHYKSKYDTDIGRLRELEQQVGQTNYWKMEAENLKRRLEMESGSMGLMGDAHSRQAIASAREDADRALRREKAVQYELEQARQAITQLKSHHDFIMRERDAQQAMEREKVVLEWQTRTAEIENRYKSQVRRVQDDMEVLQSEMDILRRRASNQHEEKNLREQISDKQIAHDRERREWEMRASKREQEFEDNKMKYNQLKREMDQKIRNKEEEKRRANDDWEEKNREKGRQCESTVRELNAKVEMLQHLLEDKDEEFETRLKCKVVEWKSEWDETEEGLRSEIRRLKNENDSIKLEEASLTNKMDSIIIESAVKVSELEDQILSKNKEIDEINRNFKVRLNCLENENKMKSTQKDDLERQIRDEKERYKTLLKKHDNLNDKLKGDLEGKVRSLTEQNSKIQDEKNNLQIEMDQLKKQKEDELHKKLSEKATNMKGEIEKERQEIENKVKLKTEKIWLEKLRKTEENCNSEIERARKAHKTEENKIRQEKDLALKADEDSKRLNEEFKKKIRTMRQAETDAGYKLGEIEERMSELKRREENVNEAHRSELSECEARFQQQVDSITVKLASKQDEFTKLSQQLTSKQEEVNRLTAQVESLKSQQGSQNQQQPQQQVPETAATTTAVPADIQEKLNELQETNIKIEQLQTSLTEHTSKIEDMQTNLHNKETKIDELKSNIQEKDSKLNELQNNLQDKEAKLDEAKIKLTDKERKYDSTRVELQYKVNELDILRTKLLKQDSEISNLAKKNLEQHIEIGRMEDYDSEEQIEELEAKITILEEKMKKVEEERDQLKTTLSEIEVERDEEIKIIQDALDEAAQEREELIQTFEKEMANLTAINTTREQQLMEDFEWKLREMEKEHKKKLDEKNRLLEERMTSVRNFVESDTEAALLRQRRNLESEEVESEFRQKMEKSRSEINSEWEDKLRCECSRLKGELDQLHAEEKHLAVESMKLQKEQEIQTLKKAWELKQEELAKEISTLKEGLTDKDSYYHQEMDSMRTASDREIWDLRRKLQKLDENMWNQKEIYDEKIQLLQAEYKGHLEDAEKRLALIQNPESTKTDVEKLYKEQMQHMADQHRSSMERLREELEADKFQALEESRVLVSKHLEYVNSTLRDQLTEACSANQLYREELEAVQMALMRREEVIRSQEEEIKKLKEKNSLAAASSHLTLSQTSLQSADSHPFFFQNSRASQDRESRSESFGTSVDEDQKSSGGLLNKMFGSGWFSATKTKENGSKSKESGRRGSKHSP